MKNKQQSKQEEATTSSPKCSTSNTSMEEESDESAWTLYLQSSCRENKRCSCDHSIQEDHRDDYESHDAGEEDLSMVSDASSGPPHFDHDRDHENDEYQIVKKKRKSQCLLLDHDFELDDIDDTASSPLYYPSPKQQKKICLSDTDNNVGEGDFCSLHSCIIYSSSASHFQV